MSEHYDGQRLSMDGALCTIRYHGCVGGTQGQWLGVEWDESKDRGKHDGSHKGKRYFRCSSDSPTAASFIRPSRPRDEPLGFLDALKEKYVSSGPSETPEHEDHIKISGKTVEEVGFEKIRQQLATLQELRIVILDHHCIAGVSARPGHEITPDWQHLRSQELSIYELDLSRNLLEEWSDVVGICCALRPGCLRTLNLDGNRFHSLDPPKVPQWRDPFSNVTSLSLGSTCFSWPDIMRLLPQFPSLSALNIPSNGLSTLSIETPLPSLKTLDLSSSYITSIHAISPLTHLPNLSTLILRNNPLASLNPPPPNPQPNTPLSTTLKTLDLTSTHLPSLSSLDPLMTLFPALTTLLTTQTPLSTTPSSTPLTIARLPTLTTINHTPITPAERQNAELYYLSTIAKQLSTATNPFEETKITTTENPRWSELCKIHGEPTIPKRSSESQTTNTLASRLIAFTFYIPHTDLQNIPDSDIWITDESKLPDTSSSDRAVQDTNEIIQKSKRIPRSMDIYRLKGIVGRLFGIQPMSCKLVWETGEWDPVGGRKGGEGWSDESDDDENESSSDKAIARDESKERGTEWERREVELIDSTREVGFWVEGKETRVRVELR